MALPKEITNLQSLLSPTAMNEMMTIPPNVRAQKIVVALDSFKGSLDARAASIALKEGIESVRPECEVMVVPVADGGEGTADVVVSALGGCWQSVECCDPLGRPHRGQIGLCGGVAIVEAASAVGLTLLREEERNPMKTTSKGVGELVRAALAMEVERVVVGLGGSATCDGGAGLLEGLGCRLLDEEGHEVVGCGENLPRIARIETSGMVKIDSRVEVLVDVTNPLYGPNGAARVFAPQKGASAADVERLDEGLRHFAEVVRVSLGVDMTSGVGAGAAGGLGGMLMALGGRGCLGGRRVVELVELREACRGANLLVAGEGCVDFQTLMGKAPSEVLRCGRECGVPTVAVGGGVRMCEELRASGFAAIYAATPEGMPLSEALLPECAAANLRRVGARLALEWL